MKLVTYTLMDDTKLVTLLTDETAKRMVSESPSGYTWKRDYSDSPEWIGVDGSDEVFTPIIVTNPEGESVEVRKEQKEGENRLTYWTNLDDLDGRRVKSIHSEEAWFTKPIRFVVTLSDIMFMYSSDGYYYTTEYMFKGKDGLDHSVGTFDREMLSIPASEFEYDGVDTWVHQHPEKLSCGLDETDFFNVKYNNEIIHSTRPYGGLRQVLDSVKVVVRRVRDYHLQHVVSLRSPQ